MKHLHKQNILNRYQHNFRQGHSYEAQLISVVLHALFRPSVTSWFNFTKAFHIIPHHHLLVKFKLHGIQSKLWIGSVLGSHRENRIVIDRVFSDWLPVKSGIQTVLIRAAGISHLRTYINDISTNVSSSLRLFADDCLLYRTIPSPEDCAKLQNGLCNIYNWSCSWHI